VKFVIICPFNIDIALNLEAMCLPYKTKNFASLCGCVLHMSAVPYAACVGQTGVMCCAKMAEPMVSQFGGDRRGTMC